MNILLALIALVATSVNPVIVVIAVAIILNLPVSPEIRFLLLLAGIWALSVLQYFKALNETMGQQLHFLRLTFITLHIRNERDGLELSRDRLALDQEIERDREECGKALSGPVGPIVEFGGWVVAAITLGAMLHLGVFGSVGVGWLERLTAR
ncbi:MAG: hypothetical protein K2Q10_03165 [Rhodospirillales bacterium]|nr:hypothetical protein [Rhodospirillales bacterium]